MCSGIACLQLLRAVSREKHRSRCTNSSPLSLPTLSPSLFSQHHRFTLSFVLAAAANDETWTCCCYLQGCPQPIFLPLLTWFCASLCDKLLGAALEKPLLSCTAEPDSEEIWMSPTADPLASIKTSLEQLYACRRLLSVVWLLPPEAGKELWNRVPGVPCPEANILSWAACSDGSVLGVGGSRRQEMVPKWESTGFSS